MNTTNLISPYDIGSYAAHLALSDWGVGWDQLSLKTRKAILTYYVVEVLQGKVWAPDGVLPRQNPKDWCVESIHGIIKGFESDKYLSFDNVRARAHQIRPEKWPE